MNISHSVNQKKAWYLPNEAFGEPKSDKMNKRGGYSMLLLTNCEVHRGKYSDRSFEVRTDRSDVRTKDLRSQYFPLWTEPIGQ